MTRRWRLALGWLLSRAVMFTLLAGVEGTRGLSGDLNYFQESLARVPQVGLAHTTPEYPLPAVGVMAIPLGLGALLGAAALYRLLLVLCLLVVDASFTAFLSGRERAGGGAGSTFWLVAGPVLGGLSIARLDLVVGVAVALALHAVRRRPRTAAAVLAAATAVKLWPVLLLPPLVSAARRRSATLGVYAGCGVLVAAVCVALAGWHRLLSPLLYQGARGLQVESVWAVPAMLGWWVRPDHWHLGYSRFLAFEIDGPGVSSLLLASTAASAVLVVVLVLSWRRVLRGGGVAGPDALVWLTLASVTGYLVCSKVVSPQYLLWLLPVTALGLDLVRSAALRRWAVGLLVVCGLSHLLYPVLYSGVVHHVSETSIAIPLLVLRNLGLVVLLAVALRQAWRATGSEPSPEPENDEAPLRGERGFVRR